MIKKCFCTVSFVFLALCSLDSLGNPGDQDFNLPKACGAAENWISGLEELPRTYEEIVALPPSYRKAVYGHLSPAEQAVLWHTQWADTLSRTDLTEEQRAILIDSLQLMSPDTLVVLNNKDDWRHKQTWRDIEAIETRAIEAFGRQQAGLLFATIGPVGSWTAKILNSLAPEQIHKRPEDCSCSSRSDFCGNYSDCGEDLDGCNGSSWGCGWFLAYACDGECLFSLVPY